jgi:hypothetical protein
VEVPQPQVRIHGTRRLDRGQSGTIPAAIILAAVTTEAILDHEHVNPHVHAPVVGQIVSTPVPRPVPATAIDIRQIEEPRS